MNKNREILPCPKCNGINTYKSGRNSALNQMIRCRDCSKTLTVAKPELSNINCLVCGQLGIRYRKPCLCRKCYQKKYYNKQRIEDSFNFIYPENFDIEAYLNKISNKYISKRANVKRDVLLYLSRLKNNPAK